MKSQIFIGILILIAQIISLKPNEAEIISFDGSFSQNYVNVEEKYFQIKITSENIPKYLKIKVNSINEGKNPNYIMTFAKSLDESSEREQISSGEKLSLMWLTKDQLDKENNLLYVACYTYPCNYTLNLESSDIISMNYNSQFNLYVTDSNKNVEVSFNPEEGNPDSTYISLWAIGNKDPEVSVEGANDYQKYSKNNIFKINSNNSTLILKITAQENDVINIGSNTFDKDLITDLNNNSPEKKGYLLRDYSNQEECYTINTDGYIETEDYYITGLIHSKIGEIYYKNQNKEIIDETVNIINNGSFIHIINPSKENKKYICIRFPTKDTDKYNIDEIYYSIQLTDPKQSDSKIGLYSAQNFGEVYPRMLKEEEIFIYTGIPIPDDTEEISFSMISQFGLPDMYFDTCTNYPLCDKYNYDNLKTLENPISLNGQSSYSINLKNSTIFSPMNKNQYVLIVKCTKSKNFNGLPCGFNTIYSSNNNKINLKENELFSHFVKKDEINFYKIDFSGFKNVEKIFVDLIIFTGDIIFNPIEKNIQAKKLYMANKIFYIITFDDALTNKKINFNVTGSKNSYYSIKYMLLKEKDDSWITNVIESGLSYLVTIDPEGKDSSGEIKPYKFVKFSNLKVYENVPFLVNFNSLNCKLNVTAKRFDEDGKYHYEPINSYDQYYQDIVFKNKENEYEYMLKINEMDSSIYNNKLCMVYASSIELYQEEDFDERQIVISDNEPRQIVFNDNVKEIEYIYPHNNKNNDVIIKFNLMDIAQYSVEISYGFKNKNTTLQTGNDIIYIHHNEWKNIFTSDDICPLVIKIKKDKSFEEKEPKLVISVKAVQNNIPSYIKKNQAQIDFLLGNNAQYYYTDLGKDEEGYAIVNYYRGSGRIYGKIVQKNIDKIEEGADWREKYKFPETVEESMEFYGYIKKIMIRKEETNKCDDGCYLLLTLKTSIESEKYFDFREHPFNIIIHTSTSEPDKDTSPIINIPLNEYIIGNINVNEIEYYTTYFTHDAENILVDFQSKWVNFYIKVGMNDKPSLTDKDFHFESFGDDTIFEITKTDFLKKCKERGIVIPYENSLLGLGMTIGIWTNKTDSLYTTVYTIKVNLPFHENEVYEKLNIYEVKSDQKTLCKPQKLKDQNLYRCLFIVFYYGIDAINHLLIHPEIQEYTPYKMHAQFIYQVGYEYYDYTFLRNKIPNKESKYTTEETGLDYLYIPHAFRRDEHLYVSIISESESIIELYTSFYTDDYQLSPNPSSPQLFSINNKFMFEFVTEEDLLVTIKSICGQAKVKWHSDPAEYDISGKDKILSLSSSLIDRSDPKKLFSNLDVTYIKTDDNCPGFAFHISHMLRPKEFNFDQIPLGKNTRIAYRDTDLPAYVYTEIFYLKKDVHSFINIYELEGTMEKGLYNISAFEISAALVNDSIIMDAKLNKTILDKIEFKYKGVYDPMINTGFVLITKEDIAKSKLEIKDGPSVILKITKNMKYPKMQDTKFSRVTLEASIIQEDTEIPIVPDIYQYGKLSLSSDKNVYRLKSNINEKYMRLEFSSVSDNIKYVIGVTEKDTDTFSFDEYEVVNKNGKDIITFDSNPKKYSYLFLIISHNSKASTDKLTNYAFKYTSSSSKDGFINYEIGENQGFLLDKKEDGNNYVYNFNITQFPYNDVNVTYFIRFTPKDDYLENEKDKSIALKETNSFVAELTDYEIKDNRIIKEYKVEEIDYRYVQVIAMVYHSGNYEIVGYGSIFVTESNWWKILLIVVAACIVVIVLIYFLRLYYKRKRDIGRNMAGLDGPMVSRFTQASIA